jgi:hypothetical protein
MFALRAQWRIDGYHWTSNSTPAPRSRQGMEYRFGQGSTRVFTVDVMPDTLIAALRAIV